MTLKVRKLKGMKFEKAMIECYNRRECSVVEALIEMYLAGVSVSRIEDITDVADLQSILKEMLKSGVETLLEAELDD